MTITADIQIFQSPIELAAIDLDVILKESARLALSEPKYLNEVDRIKSFLNNIKKAKTSDIDFIETTKASVVPIISELFMRSQVLEDNMCQYPECLLGVKDDVLNSIRIVDVDSSVPEDDGKIHLLKQGDLIVEYNSGGGEAGYLVKSGLRSKRFHEKYIKNGSNFNYKVIGVDANARKSDWLFISANLLSGVAIHQATSVLTIAVPVLVDEVIESLIERYPNRRIGVFLDSDQMVQGLSRNDLFFARKTNPIGCNWSDLRAQCVSGPEDKKGIELFRDELRQALKLALNKV